MIERSSFLYFGIASILAISIIATLTIFNFVAKPQPVEAIQGIVPNVPFGVDLTETLISLDRNKDGDLDDIGEREASGYTFTVQSDASFTASSVMTVTFPPGTGALAGIDLKGANEDLGNYELYDPVDQRFEAAFHPTLKPVSGEAVSYVDGLGWRF